MNPTRDSVKGVAITRRQSSALTPEPALKSSEMSHRSELVSPVDGNDFEIYTKADNRVQENNGNKLYF